MASYKFYNVKVRYVHDGDTATLNIDLLLKRTLYEGPCRLLGVDTLELDKGSPEQQDKAQKAQRMLELLLRRKILLVDVYGFDKYGRPLVTIFVQGKRDGKEYTINVNKEMLDSGYTKSITVEKQKKQNKNPHLTVTKKNIKHLWTK